MSLLNNSNAISTGGGYNLENSLRFRSSASAYLNRTPATASNRKTWTMSMWVKRGNNAYQQLAYASESPTYADPVCLIGFSSDNIDLFQYTSSFDFRLITTQVFRDPSAWYHIVWSVDTTQATSTNRVKLYVNGEQVTSFTTATYPSLNFDTAFNYTGPHLISARGAGGSVQEFFDGYLTEVNFIDGQALTPSDFGETNSTTGVWQPIEYTGTYGTNGFYLPFTPTTQATGFNTVTYTGTGASQAITGVGFEPDFTWIKQRSGTEWYILSDVIRGTNKQLFSNSTNAEQTNSTFLTSYDSDGFTVGTSTGTNNSGSNYVAWCWDAGSGSPVTNAAGTNGATIESTYKANPATGFSVVTYTGNGTSGATVGHGLGVSPSMMIVKVRNSGIAHDWRVYHSALGNTKNLQLNLADSVQTTIATWNNTSPSSTVFTLGSGGATNESGTNLVAYCFSDVAGYQKIGSYTGNGSTTGPVVDVGFEPAFVLIKRTDSARNWVIFDNTRNPVNERILSLEPNVADAEYTNTNTIDFVSNGFQPKSSGPSWNSSGGNYIYLAIADTRDAKFNFDASGNKNNWTANNINSNASTATTYDIMTDVPTLTDEDTANYAVMNPLKAGPAFTLSQGNLYALSAVSPYSYGSVLSTIGMPSNKWYWEITIGATQSAVGIALDSIDPTTYFSIGTAGWAYNFDGSKRTNGTDSSYGASYTTNDVIGVAFDADSGSLTFYKNNTSQGVAFSGLAANTYFAAICDMTGGGTGGGYFNFGQRPFAYTPPAGYLKLNTFNLPDSSIVDGSKNFNTVTYTGQTASSNFIDNGDGTWSQTGLDFGPDLTWIKVRNSASYEQMWFDSVRGATKYVRSNSTAVEGTVADSLTSFDSNGFSLGANGDVNGSTFPIVAWNWKAGGAPTTTNTAGVGAIPTAGSVKIDGVNLGSVLAGSIAATSISANTTAGFSVVTYTGVSATSTIAHGLGVAPKFIITKLRNLADGWYSYHESIGNNKFIRLDTTGASTTSTIFGNTSPTSTVFTNEINNYTCVAYCFAEVEGFSKIGSYTGNGSADGIFVYTGFTPAFVMVKRTNSSLWGWVIIDNKRSTASGNNLIDKSLLANAADSEYAPGSGWVADFLSNGFKFRMSANHSSANGNGDPYIYMAFAENPFKNSLAR
jgi:hypothetical protein